LAEEFGVAIPPTLLFEYPSIESLAQHLIRELVWHCQPQRSPLLNQQSPPYRKTSRSSE